jgi:hypothetical protein
MFANVRERYGCVDCGYFTNLNSNIKRHKLSRNHLLKISPEVIDPLCKYQCKVCCKKYTSHSGLWSHNQKCKKNTVPVENVFDTAQTIPQLSNEIKELKSIIIDLVKNQQPTIINNNNNNNININITLNEKCGNACNIKQFLENIEFKYEHIDRILSDYVNGNAEIIARNYNALPQLERPFYSFAGEDTNQEIVHIKHDDNWIAEPEIKWHKRIQMGKDLTDSEEDSLPSDSMYSFIRMFDKNKLKNFEEKFLKDDIYKKGRRLERDCCDPDLQSLLINKLISMATTDVSILN